MKNYPVDINPDLLVVDRVGDQHREQLLLAGAEPLPEHDVAPERSPHVQVDLVEVGAGLATQQLHLSVDTLLFLLCEVNIEEDSPHCPPHPVGNSLIYKDNHYHIKIHDFKTFHTRSTIF